MMIDVGEGVYVNPAYIVKIEPYFGGSKISLVEGDSENSNIKPEDIVLLIKQAKTDEGAH